MNSRLQVAATAIVLLTALAATPLQAQLTHVYQAKITCGYNTGDVPLLSDPNPFPHKWENFKPGNYATSINITNSTFAQQRIYGYLSLTDYPNFPLLFLGFADIPLFGALEVGCVELQAAFPATLAPGQFVEGVLNLFSSNDDFHIDAVYTFESKDAFERHLFIAFNDATGDVVVKEAHGSGPATVPIAEPQFLGKGVAGSGAGGLGVGASIDVEDVEVRRLITAMTTADLDVRATLIRNELVPLAQSPGASQSPGGVSEGQPGGQ